MAKTDMMRHYESIKEKYKDCIVFYRLGDFYEMFNEDAIKASEILEITLTGRDCGMDERAPMCGVPYHAADAYISRLIAAGEKVAICEQLEEPTKGKKLVERDVVRVITAGTVTEESMMDEKKSNYICSVFLGDGICGLAWCDITTGQFYTKKCSVKDLIPELNDNLVKINPSEIICNPEAFASCSDISAIKHHVIPKMSSYGSSHFKFYSAEKTLKEHFNVVSLDAFGISDRAELVIACGALLDYLVETQKHALININELIVEEKKQFLDLDYNTIRNLELMRNSHDAKRYGSLLWLIDRTSTAMGARNISKWLLSPLLDKEKINYRLDGVEELFHNTIMLNGILDLLRFIKDTERLSGKISNKNITPRDCVMLRESLKMFPSLKMILFGSNSKILKDVNDNITDFSELTSLLDMTIMDNSPVSTSDGGYIKAGFDKELDRLRTISADSRDIIKAKEIAEREQTGIKGLKIGYNRVFGYYIEVTNSFKDLVPDRYIRKQTLVGAERYITEELKNLEEEILTSDEKARKIEAEIYAKIKNILDENIKPIQKSSRAIACLDTLCSFASIAKKNNYSRPEIGDRRTPLNIVGGRHPVVEAVSKNQFIPNDALLDNEENRLLILTGPNMAGKSTYMRQTALIVLMAHIGSFVPAKSAEVPLTDRIFTRVGASDNIILDQSTFLVEMSEVASILLYATEDSLLILDEVGRGTSTYDGLSIAWAVVEQIAKKTKAKTLFATHYHELSELEGVVDGVKNYKITVKESGGEIVFLRKIMRGSANRSFGIEVAALAGIPKSVTVRAKQILKELEKNDLTKKMTYADVPEPDPTTCEPEEPVKTSEVEEIIRNTDINSMTPIDAIRLLADLKGRL